MKKRSIILASIVSLFVLVGCGNSNTGGSYGTIDESTQNQVVDTSTTRKIVYNVGYQFTVGNIVDTDNKIKSKASELKGYVEKSYIDVNNGQVTYRIPTESLNSFLNYVDTFEGQKNKSVTATDITVEYVSNEEKIETLKKTKEVYENLLLKENITTDEVVRIRGLLEDIDTELQTYEKIKNQYDSTLDYSKVEINYSLKERNFFSRYGEYLSNFFVKLFEFLLYVLPFMMIAGIVFGIVYICNIQNRKKREKIRAQRAHEAQVRANTPVFTPLPSVKEEKKDVKPVEENKTK